MDSIENLIQKLELQPHPEGGYFKETYRSDDIISKSCLPDVFESERNYSTGIYYLLKSDDFSAFHKINQDEMWHFYLGDTIELTMISEDGVLTTVHIGNDILLDQVPRNLFRSDPKAFATDTKALDIAQSVVAKGWDKSLTDHQRVFLYLPFEHSEDLSVQQTSLNLYRGIGEDSDWYDYALKHEVIVRKFGRFPHRNQVLDRESTPEEVAFLKQPGSSF